MKLGRRPVPGRRPPPAPPARRRQDRAGLRDGDEHRRQRRPAARGALDAQGSPTDDRRLPDRQRAGGPAVQRRHARPQGNVYEGGIRVPCYVRWPGQLPAGPVVDRIAAHIDLTPTLLDACGVPAGTEPARRPEPAALAPRRARSLWPDRTLYFQWHRGDVPELGRAFAARSQRFKLLRPRVGRRSAAAAGALRHRARPVRAARPRGHASRDGRRDVSRITSLGSATWAARADSSRSGSGSADPRENPTLLTRQDWRVGRAPSSEPATGSSRSSALGDMRWPFTFLKATVPDQIHLDIQGKISQATLPGRASAVLSRRISHVRSHQARSRVRERGDRDSCPACQSYACRRRLKVRVAFAGDPTDTGEEPRPGAAGAAEQRFSRRSSRGIHSFAAISLNKG